MRNITMAILILHAWNQLQKDLRSLSQLGMSLNGITVVSSVKSTVRWVMRNSSLVFTSCCECCLICSLGNVWIQSIARCIRMSECERLREFVMLFEERFSYAVNTNIVLHFNSALFKVIRGFLKQCYRRTILGSPKNPLMNFFFP